MITCKIIIAINQSNPYEHFNKSSNKSKVNFALKKKKKTNNYRYYQCQRCPNLMMMQK